MEKPQSLILTSGPPLKGTMKKMTNLLKALNGVIETLQVIQNTFKDDPALNKKSSVEFIQATALKQEEHLALWAKSSTFMAWNLGPRMTAIESSQAEIKNEVSSLRQVTSDIKCMMTKIYQAFKGETYDINEDKVEKEQVSEEPKHVVPISSVKPTETPELVKASSIVRPDPDAPILVPYMINGKMFYLTEEQIQAHMDKEDQNKKAKEEAK
ncbi:hypothetical protein Tco_0115344 [Tanacetum coccineum]